MNYIGELFLRLVRLLKKKKNCLNCAYLCSELHGPGVNSKNAQILSVNNRTKLEKQDYSFLKFESKSALYKKTLKCYKGKWNEGIPGASPDKIRSPLSSRKCPRFYNIKNVNIDDGITYAAIEEGQQNKEKRWNFIITLFSTVFVTYLVELLKQFTIDLFSTALMAHLVELLNQFL